MLGNQKSRKIVSNFKKTMNLGGSARCNHIEGKVYFRYGCDNQPLLRNDHSEFSFTKETIVFELGNGPLGYFYKSKNYSTLRHLNPFGKRHLLRI